MNIYPKNLAEQVDFNHILQRVHDYCYCSKAKQMAIELSPSASFARIRLQLTETNEFLLAIHKGDPLHVSNFPDIEKELQLLTIENAVLSTQQMTHIRKAVTITNELIRFFNDKESIYPYLKKRTDFLTEDTFIVPAINDIIDKDGIVKDNASVLLASIRNDLQSNRKTCDRIYRAHIQRLKKLGHLADFEESFVNGRRVLGVLAEHKRETKGIILSQSSTGKITFIEPQNVIELNNDRLELEEEEKKEIYRILKELTALIQPYQGLLSDYFKTLIDFDFIHAKAQLAKELNATMPQLVKNGHCIHLMNAFHPVLYLQNKEKKQETQPITCKFSDTERIMVISGPNAGGKSITLKTIGLLQIMMQCGLLIPASAKSEMSIKQSIFGDIGDNQSIEDGLSTYSSRLMKMKYFLEKTDADTLFLIDEFGTGSDPDMGGALAEVILDKLNDARAQGVVTTHFTNLKILATNKEGIFNACMLFNSKTLKPLYLLQIGEPGSSFTFEVAEKIGLSPAYIDEAKEKLSTEKVYMDKLLNKLQAEKNVIARLKKDLQKQMSKTTAEKREFQELSEKATESLFRENKDRVEKQRLMDYGKKLEQLTLEWQESKNRKDVISKFVKLAGFETHKKKTKEEFERSEQFKAGKLAKIKSKITIGSKVRLLNSRELGVIKEINTNRAMVSFGNVMMDVGLEKLELA